MNSIQKEQITNMRNAGMSCNEIANALYLSVNTVKSFCRRSGIHPSVSHGTTSNIQALSYCKQCGKELKQIKGGRVRQFCSDTCRSIWWSNHKDLSKKKAYYKCQCSYCGKDFTSYGNSHRKYCSHACYIQARFYSKNIHTIEQNCLAIGLSQSVNTTAKGDPKNEANTSN